MSGPRGTLRRASIRVALGATAIVAVFYLVVAVGAYAAVTRVLTNDLDARLQDTLLHITRDTDHGAPEGGYQPPPPDRPFGPTQLLWTVLPDGTVMTNTAGAVLPEEALGVVDPETVSIGGTEVRIAGMDVEGGRVIVGQRTAELAATQATVLVAELIIGAALLILVFLGSVAIGRRVAAPIERARQRQLAFTADASHELRTPVSVIEAQTSLALSGERDPESDRDAFRRIDRESRRIHRLLDDLLWLARFDALQGTPDAEPVDAGVMAEATADRFAVVAETRHLDLAVEVAPGSHVVSMPPEWLDRLLGVLVDNACKYSPDGGAVRVHVGDEAGRVTVTVDDAGPGIPDEQREAIFDRFHRATDSKGGAGLGLAIADGIVRATHGHWRVGSSPLGGASMTVSWPRAFSGSPERSGAEETVIKGDARAAAEARSSIEPRPGTRPSAS
jgi:two-component system sensor histidine kinase CiaH